MERTGEALGRHNLMLHVIQISQESMYLFLSEGVAASSQSLPWLLHICNKKVSVKHLFLIYVGQQL